MKLAAICISFFLILSFRPNVQAAEPDNSKFASFKTQLKKNNPSGSVEKVTLNKPFVRSAKILAPNAADILNWIEDPNSASLCGGYYLEPSYLVDHPIPAPFKSVPTAITSKHEAFFSRYGASVLVGDVTISQPGRVVIADKVTLWRDKSTKRVTDIDLFGNVHYQEHGKLITAQKGHLDLTKKTGTLNNAAYRLELQTKEGAINSWGKAKKIYRDAMGVLHMQETSFTTCPPNNVAWRLTGKKISIDKNSGRGTANSCVFYARRMPIAYLPYLNFPIDDRRKSGFLYPNFANSSDSGFSIAWPYYFNLAPNYDLMLTPELMTKRGLYTEGLFRYLTQKSEGSLSFGYIPYDSAFSAFQDTAPSQYNKPSQAHALSILENASDSRGFVSYANKTVFNQHLIGNLNLNYASDDYFQTDYNDPLHAESLDQLFNQGEIHYRSDNWQFLGRLQAYQTLHPLTTIGVEDQYMRLPQFDLSANYPHDFFGLHYGFVSQYTRFDHRDDFETGLPVVTGDRAYIMPNINLPLRWSGIYLLPKLDLAAIQYSLKNTLPNGLASPGQAIPLFSLDGGMFLQRPISFFGMKYNQTLEPRIYYLYVPIRQQDDLPNFDTVLPTFTFESLFRNNRFSGFDRIGDANQISLGITSRFLDDYTGEEKLNASIGQIYLFQKHHVCLENNCQNDPDPMSINRKTYFSPFVGKLVYAITSNWDARGDLAFDPSTRTFNNTALTLQYHQGDSKIINLGYNFVKNGDEFNDNQKNLNRVDFAFAWPITRRWHIIGDLNYNLSFIHPQTYFFGIEYESCCFALRLIQSQTFKSVDANRDLLYENKFYLQFLFKGIGAIGTSGAGDLLTSRIINYNDKFAMRPKI